MLGASKKHNPNLLSCTYYSGLVANDTTALISYGINDLDFSFAEVTKSELGF